MKISEIFASIQGESSYAGLPCSFIRLSGCNLRCSYCDTRYAYEEGYYLTVDEIIGRIRAMELDLVEITGGEPLLQRGVHNLMRALLEDGRKVLLETNGSQSIREVDRRAVIVLDIKTPGSGMSDLMDFSNLYEISARDEVKFVVTGRSDYEWARGIMHSFDLARKCQILVSPAFGFVRPEDLARWMLNDRLEARLNLQLHKYLFGSGERGV